MYFFSDRAMGCSAGRLKPLAKRSRQCGLVDSTSDSQSDMHSSGFEFRSGHLLDFFMVITISDLQPRFSIANMLPPNLVPRVLRVGENPGNEVGCCLPVGVFNPVVFYSDYFLLIICVECLSKRTR